MFLEPVVSLVLMAELVEWALLEVVVLLVLLVLVVLQVMQDALASLVS